MALLDGPRLPPAAGGPPRQLVVCLHGYGADGNDLIGLGRQWAQALPHAAFVSPHAPEPCGAAPMGRQWFNLTFRDPGELVRGISHASPALAGRFAGSLASPEAIRASNAGSNPDTERDGVGGVQVRCAVISSTGSSIG